MGCDYYVYYEFIINYIANTEEKTYIGSYSIPFYAQSCDDESEKKEIQFFKDNYLLNKTIIENNNWIIDSNVNDFHFNNCEKILKEINYDVILSAKIKSEFYIR